MPVNNTKIFTMAIPDQHMLINSEFRINIEQFNFEFVKQEANILFTIKQDYSALN